MRTNLYAVPVFAIAMAALTAADKPPATPQVERGRQIFLHSAKGTACATCHALGGVGNAVGPDLTTMATYGTVHVLVGTMQMTMTEHVVLVKTADAKFPAFLKQKTAEESEYWDLSQRPPVLKKLATKDIVSAERDQKWTHPPAAADYTAQELADVIGFLKWAATGAVKEIKPSEVEQ